MTPTQVIAWLEDCAEARALKHGEKHGSTVTTREAVESLRNALRVSKIAQAGDAETIATQRQNLDYLKQNTVSMIEWEVLYDSREAERAQRRSAEARLAKIQTYIEESDYFGSLVAPRGAAKVLHEIHRQCQAPL
jgi:hypothetical protein